MKEAVIVSGARTAVGKAFKGTLSHTRPDDLMAHCLRETVLRSGVNMDDIDDVIVGCAMPEQEQGMNIGRISLLKAGIPTSVPGMTINRFCSSGLQSIALAAERIIAGGADVILAGGVESMSLVNFLNAPACPNPAIAAQAPGIYTPMGLTAENVANKYKIDRLEADEFAVASQQKAERAIQLGKFKDEIAPYTVSIKVPEDNRIVDKQAVFEVDEGVRPGTTLMGLAHLKPVFHPKGVCTAANSSQMSDGAAATLVCSREYAEAHNLEIMASFVGYQVAGVPPEIMGIGPVAAIPKVLQKTGLSLNDMKVIELNEAFATQSIAVTKELGLNSDIVNPNGGAIALGHPLGCTGAKLTLTALHETRRKGGGYAMVTMCVGGGMGAAGIFKVEG